MPRTRRSWRASSCWPTVSAWVASPRVWSAPSRRRCSAGWAVQRDRASCSGRRYRRVTSRRASTRPSSNAGRRRRKSPDEIITRVDYRGKRAVVTGASSGLGRRLALDLAAAGASVVGVARREDRLRGLGLDYRVCDMHDVNAYIEVLRDVGPVDLLLQVAGMG